jgi:hypothetical protein
MHRTIAILLALTTTAAADDTWSDRWHPGVEVGPLFPALLDGYLVAASLRTPAAPRWRFVASAFGVTIPDAFQGDANDGWSVHDNGFGAGAQREFGHRERGGWLLGANLAGQRRRTSFGGSSGTLVEYDLDLEAGYRWFPWASLGATVTGSLGVIVPLHRGAEPVIDGMTYTFQPVAVVPTINLGWEL